MIPMAYVNLRAAKSADAAVIATVKSGEPVTFEWDNDLDWYKVTLASGKSGWMHVSRHSPSFYRRGSADR